MLGLQSKHDQARGRQIYCGIKQQFWYRMRRLRADAADEMEGKPCPNFSKGMKRIMYRANQPIYERQIKPDTFTSYISSPQPPDPLPTAIELVQFFCVNGFQKDIEHAIRLGKNGKAPGQGKICLEMQKLNLELFAAATFALWKAAGRIGLVPMLPRMSLLAPAYKAGDTSKAENYCSITPISKFWKMVTKAVVWHIRQAYTLNSKQ